MERFEINGPHIESQFRLRYKNFGNQFEKIFHRIVNALKENTPDDWRFTESPTSRFFIIEEETHAKFMGMSYRDGEKSRIIAETVRKNTDNLKFLFENLSVFVNDYKGDILNPNLPIIHQVRTVYPRKKGEIAEEKHMFEQAKSLVTHTIPLEAKKIAARPNVIISKEGTLWVRQYMNWMGMKEGEKEYYLFHPLEKNGIRKDKYAVFSHSENGKIDKIVEKSTGNIFEKTCNIKSDFSKEIGSIKGRDGAAELRSESYWKVPTYLDRRFIDLDFVEKHIQKVSLSTFGEEQIRGLSSNLIEFHFLGKIIDKARKKLYCV